MFAKIESDVCKNNYMSQILDSSEKECEIAMNEILDEMVEEGPNIYEHYRIKFTSLSSNLFLFYEWITLRKALEPID